MVLLTSALSACATSTPPLPRIESPTFSGHLKNLEWIRNFQDRIDVRGASVLPPHGRFERWARLSFPMERGEAVGIGTMLEDERILMAIIISSATGYESWKQVRSLTPTQFQEFARAVILYGEPKPRKLVVQPPTALESTCARFEAEGDISLHVPTGAIRPAVLLGRGNVCIHPESPRLFLIFAGQAVPEGSRPWDQIEIEMAPFLDSLKFHPMGVAQEFWAPGPAATLAGEAASASRGE